VRGVAGQEWSVRQEHDPGDQTVGHADPLTARVELAMERGGTVGGRGAERQNGDGEQELLRGLLLPARARPGQQLEAGDGRGS
jgi:hypothetical protein